MPKMDSRIQDNLVDRQTLVNVQSTSSSFEHPNLSYDDSIRLLRILRSQEEDPLRCELFVSRLSTAETCPYTALSYAWGDPTPCCSISLNGRSFKLPTNAFEALIHLREPDSDLTLWIDTICINQNDATEKAYQVAMMGQIFSRAHDVIAWVGPAFDGVDELFGCWAGLEHRIREGLAGKDTYAEQLPVMLKLASELTERQLNLYTSLVSRPWFTRLWIVQEVALASQTRIRCGPSQIGFRLFGDVSQVYARAMNRRKDYNTVGVRNAQLTINTLARLEWTQSQGGTLRLADISYYLLAANVSDPRDRVFGLLGIIDHLKLCAKQRSEPFPISYNVSCSNVFFDAAVWSIKQDLDLRILSLRSSSHRNGTSGPTWVPDFSPLVSSSFTLRAELSQEGTYNADGGHEISCGQDWWLEHGGKRIVFRGQCCSTVENIFPSLSGDKDLRHWIETASGTLAHRGLNEKERWRVLSADLWLSRTRFTELSAHCAAFVDLCTSKARLRDAQTFSEVRQLIRESADGDWHRESMANELLDSMYGAAYRRSFARTADDRYTYIPRTAPRWRRDLRTTRRTCSLHHPTCVNPGTQDMGIHWRVLGRWPDAARRQSTEPR